MIYSFSPFGYEGAICTIETDLRRGIPSIDIVGLSDGCVSETRERTLCAVRNSGLEFPKERVLISLSPCDLKKEGAGFDLPLALSVLLEKYRNEKNQNFEDKKVLVLGELELSGTVRSVKGVYAALQNALSCGIEYAIIPDTTEELPEGIKVFKAENLKDAYEKLILLFEGNDKYFLSTPQNKEEKINVQFMDVSEEERNDFDQTSNDLTYALMIGIAGRHNVIAIGSPGSGKTMAMQKAIYYNPLLNNKEKQQVTRIWSLAGLTGHNKSITVRPFRTPHQTASIEGICGGGVNCRPGEISLAHNGTLFLDEAAEFRSSVLQMLRVPLESKSITLSRAGRSTTYPANFQLFMAVNPCPCGNYGSKTKICLCSAKSVDQYWKKFSAPLLDRVDLKVDMNKDYGFEKLTLEKVRNNIKTAWEKQYERQGKLNSDLSPSEILEYIKLTEEMQNNLDNAILRYGFSPRTISSILKTSRTVADIEGSEEVKNEHLETSLKLHKICATCVYEDNIDLSA